MKYINIFLFLIIINCILAPKPFVYVTTEGVNTFIFDENGIKIYKGGELFEGGIYKDGKMVYEFQYLGLTPVIAYFLTRKSLAV
jgi:Na+-translocating ferredoxin:NAD+ oxidoreductase RnfE subunit